MAILLRQLLGNCSMLDSNKVTERKKYIDMVHNSLEDQDVLQILNTPDHLEKWYQVIDSIHSYLIKEAEKMNDDEKKKKTVGKPRSEVLLLAITSARAACGVKFDIGRLLKIILEIFDSFVLRKYYLEKYLVILHDYVLSDLQYCSKITNQQWIDLLTVLRNLNSLEDSKVLSCMKLIFKWGPMHKLPLTYLRSEFDFVNKLCQRLQDARLKRHKVEVLEILTDFCHKNTSDCCLSCCKLGEDVFPHLRLIYQPTTTDITVKELLFEFFLLQVKLHHPQGVFSTNKMAYAFSLTEWKKQLTGMYVTIDEEMKYQLRCSSKTSFLSGDVKNASKIHNTFVSLCTEVFRQIFNNEDSNDIQAVDCTSTVAESSMKRQRINISLTHIFQTIKENQCWQWIYIMTEYLRKYPGSLKSDDFNNLLQIILHIHQNSQNSDIIKHCYECFYVLLDAEEHIKDLAVIADVERIYESTLRCIGLNRNIDETHKLLQKIVTKGIVKDVLPLYEIFFSRAILLSSESLKTFKIAADCYDLPELINNISLRKTLIQWMLDAENDKTDLSNAFTDQIMAEVLFKLCLKHWPKDCKDEDGVSESIYESFEKIYEYNAFEKLVRPQKRIVKSNTEKVFHLNKDTYDFVLDQLEIMAVHSLEEKNHPSYLKNISKKLCLFANFISTLDKCDELSNVGVILKKIKFEELFSILCAGLMKYNETGSTGDSKYSKELLLEFNLLLSTELSCLASKSVRSFVTIDLLKSFFGIINIDLAGKSFTNDLKKLKLLSIDILSNFCFYDNCNGLSEIQEYVLDTLTDPNYDYFDAFDYKMVSTLLSRIKRCPANIISEEVLPKILNLIQDMCFARFTEYNPVIFVLEVLKDLVKHVVASKNAEVRSNYIRILSEFFKLRVNYGYNVSIAMIRCIGQFIEVERNTNSLFDADETNLIMLLPEFLTSEYQEVRLEAIFYISSIFGMDGLTDDMLFLIQRTLFKAVTVKSVRVFQLEVSTMDKERAADETVARTSSILHTYGSLMVSSSLWRSKLLYFLIQLACDKKMNTNFLNGILNLVAVELKFSDKTEFLTSYADYLLNEWSNDGRNMTEFPYDILGCQSDADFYEKYANIIIPWLILKGDMDSINKISTYLNKELVDMFEMYFPEIFANIYLFRSKNSTTANNTFSHVLNILHQDKRQKLLLEHAENIIVQIVKTVVDEATFVEQFDMPFQLLGSRENSTLQNFKDSLLLLQTDLDLSINIFEFMSANHPNKIQNMLMQLQINVERNLTPEDKTKALHQYAVVINSIAICINTTNHHLSIFLTRSVVYFLLNYITVQNCNIFNIVACKFLQKYCEYIANTNSELLKDHITTIINKLIPVVKKGTDLSQECLKVLRHLILENTDKYKDAIQDLDPLPSTSNCIDMNDVCLRIRLSVVKGGLEGDIRHFLRGGANVESRTVALTHLRKQLSLKKHELRILHEKCKDAVGYSKNNNDSGLHNLIQMLFKLTASADNEEANEAARCLGELGPLDLSTLILHPGKLHHYPESAPFQLLTAQVIELLSTYIIEADIELVKASSEVLYSVLNCKEGKHFIDHLNSECKLNHDYLYPFIMKQTNKASIIQLQKEKFQINVVELDTWWPNDQDHGQWIYTLACKLLDCFSNRCFLHKLVPICGHKMEFCEEVLPHVIHLIMSTGGAQILEAITTQINNFFEKISSILLQTQMPSYDEKKRSVQTMLNVVHFLRLNYKKCPQLHLDYLKIAHAALYCSNFYAAVLYMELWSSQTRTVNPGGCTILDSIFETETENIASIVRTTLKQSFTALGDLYALSGSNFFDNLHPEDGLEAWQQLSKWDEVIVDYDILIANGQTDKTPALINAWKNYGCFTTATMLESPQIDYECLWRLNRFNNDDFKGTPADLYEKHKFESLKWLQENDCGLFNATIKDARQSVIEAIRQTSLESTKDLYCCLTKLQSIQELEDAANAKRDLDLQSLLRKWKEQDRLANIDFQSIEPIKAQRISILNVLAKSDLDDSQKSLMESYLDLAEIAKNEGYFNVAKRAVRNLHCLSQESQKYDCLRIFQEAQICWLMGNKMRAKYLLKHLLKTNEDDPRLKFASLKMYGKWMAETRSENPDIILNDYFLGSLKSIKGVDLTDKDKQDVFATYDVIARFADAEYERILSYIRSTEFERKVKNMEESKRTASKMESQNRNLSYDQRKAVTVHKKQSLIDETEIENTYREKDAYWKLAMKYYLISLQHSDIGDISVFRVLSLLLENRSFKGSENLLGECLPRIPSYKFIPILPQLAPHLTNNAKDDFGKLVATIIERCAKDHPHHTLPIILALANSNKDSIFSKSARQADADEARVLGAKILLEKIKREVAELKNTIEEMELAYSALTEFAYITYEACEMSKKSDTYLIPNSAKLKSMKNYAHMLLPTCTLSIKRSGNYDNITGIYSYSKEFGKVGGINNPKRLYCRGTDGVVYSQLLKGKDDLRQDAVMEQVFENINSLLRTNKHTRHLHIRTYKVVPLSKRSGVVEWVEGSIRIGDYLVKAHAEYNSRDWKFEACKSGMVAVAKKSSADKVKKFKQICDNFKPVFRKFFETNYLDPVTWYDRRKAYMHSVATTSMCGYVLGLGDRHPHNILLDEHTAEVIHIDFGIAFEQGKVLPTPETVPFRLTRDIEDAMGVTGIEGIFRKSCEKTMEVMRNNHETITTILEVLLYDPLYEWTVSPSEAYNMQFRGEDGGNDCTTGSPGGDEESIPMNVSAARALLRVKQKLRGTEEGGASSVEGQVEQLLQQARDISNLSRLYVGWQPFL